MRNHLPALCALNGQRLPRTEYRQIELYSRKRKLEFLPPPAPAGDPLARLAPARLAGQCLAEHFAADDPLLLEGKDSWQRYLDLPRRHTGERVVAELYRILRIVRIVSLHRDAHREFRNGLLRLSCNYRRCALSLDITPAGLDLLSGAVWCYLDSFEQPYADAYVEALLLQYFFDLVGEIRKFADEDRVLYQFRRKYPYFNRHFRYDCDNPKFTHEETQLSIEIGAGQNDPARFPIDFYLPLADGLHIVPVEALSAGSIALADLAQWRIRSGGKALPAHFAARFSREEMIVGLPMT